VATLYWAKEGEETAGGQLDTREVAGEEMATREVMGLSSCVTGGDGCSK